jgi:hypothetical protein
VVLTKYASNAGALLAISLLVTTGALGYPHDTGGVLVSALLVWLGLLFVLGTANVLSVAPESTLLAVAGTFLVYGLIPVVSAFVARREVGVLLLSSTSMPWRSPRTGLLGGIFGRKLSRRSAARQPGDCRGAAPRRAPALAAEGPLIGA